MKYKWNKIVRLWVYSTESKHDLSRINDLNKPDVFNGRKFNRDEWKKMEDLENVENNVWQTKCTYTKNDR